MQFVENGLVYDTATAEKLAEVNGSIGATETEALYRTPSGKYFSVENAPLAEGVRTTVLTEADGKAAFSKLAARGGALVDVKDVFPDAVPA